MILHYGMSIAGSAHLEKGKPCQDAHVCRTLPGGFVLATVADGVGSAAHSEIASRMACDVLAESCEALLTPDTEITAAPEILLEGYRRAETRIREYAKEAGHAVTEYDTTLSAVIFDGETAAFGHSGDGGIAALTRTGDYIKLTEPQKADDGYCVIPLRAGEAHWEFGICGEALSGVLLATDGVYDALAPYLLRGQTPEFYVPLIRYFLDGTVYGVTAENIREFEESRRQFLTGESCRAITDDKTVLAVMNTDAPPAAKDASYYAEPDWAALQEAWNRRAYPHLYKNDSDGAAENRTDAEAASAQEKPETLSGQE